MENLRKLFIEAIANGDVNRLKALKILANESGKIETFYKVVDDNQIFTTNGHPIELPVEKEETIPGILPKINAVIVCFSSYSEMQKVLREHPVSEPFLKRAI